VAAAPGENEGVIPSNLRGQLRRLRNTVPALALDASRLADYLAKNIEGFAGPLDVKQFKGGQSNPTYLLETPARRYVLRRKPPGKLLPSAHAVDREYRVIRALHAQGFPVAEPLAFCADDGVAGTPFYVMSFADGRVFWEPQMPGSNPAERAAVYDAMNDTIARLQAYQEAGADVLYAPGPTSAEQIRAIVSSVDRPVNVLVRPGSPTVAELAQLGVSRISVGGSFAFAAIDALVSAGRELRDAGTYGYAERSGAGARAAREAFR